MTDFNNSPGASTRLRDEADGRFRNKPNFLLIVVLSAAILVVLLIAATFFVSWDGRHLMLKPSKSPASMTEVIAPPISRVA